MVKKEKPRARPRKPALDEEAAQKFLARVPEDKIFWCCNGATFRDLHELAAGLAAMSDDVFAYHVNPGKNDFCNWIGDVIGDQKLVSELVNATTREQAAICVSDRVALLTG